MEKLHESIIKGDIKECHNLIERGENINFQNKEICTPLVLAVVHGRMDIFCLLIRYCADVNIRSHHSGETALHHAVLYGMTEMCEKLIFAGAKINQKDRIGDTPLKYAKDVGNEYLIELLTKHGGKI